MGVRSLSPGGYCEFSTLQTLRAVYVAVEEALRGRPANFQVWTKGTILHSLHRSLVPPGYREISQSWLRKVQVSRAHSIAALRRKRVTMYPNRVWIEVLLMGNYCEQAYSQFIKINYLPRSVTVTSPDQSQIMKLVQNFMLFHPATFVSTNLCTFPS